MHGAAEPAIGKEAIRELVAALLRLVDDHIVFEYDMSGTFDGTRFMCDGVDAIAVADGLVTRKDTYLDYLRLMDQIGKMPKIGAAVEPSPRLPLGS